MAHSPLRLVNLLREGMGINVDESTAENLLKLADHRGENGYVQWMSRDGKNFSPASVTRGVLPPGIYEIDCDMNIGIFFSRVPTNSEGLIRLPDTTSDTVVSEIQKFWDRENLFRDYHLAYKRGILLHGPPGGGKTSTIRILSEDLIKRGGVLFKFGDPRLTAKGLRIFREIQPNTPCVLLMEDLDSILEHNIESEVINILDGVDLINKVVFLATTNYPEKLGERVINRPSRFDRRFYIGPPNEASRLLFFKFLFQQGMEKPEDKSLVDLVRWVRDTDGMSIAHLKELFVACVILGTPYEEALKTLKSMEILPDSTEYRGRRLRRMNVGMAEVTDEPSVGYEPKRALYKKS